MLRPIKLIKSVVGSVIRSVAKGVANDPEVRRLLSCHPRLVKFVRRRLTADEKFGLYLTVGVLVAAWFVYLFFGVVVDLIGPQPLIQSDLNIINLTQVLRGPVFNQAMLLVTTLGEWPVIFVGVACVASVLSLDRRRPAVTVLLLSVAGAEVFSWAVRNMIERPRPELVNVLVPTSGTSFPSSHVLVSVAFYGLLTYVVFSKMRPSWRRWLLVAAGAVLIMTIGFSRIYLGAHWPSDIFASYAAGAAWLTVLITAVEIRRRFDLTEPPEPHLGRRQLAVYATVATLAWAGFFFWHLGTHPLQTPAAEEPVESLFLSPTELTERLFDNLPRISESITGETREPINVIVIASRQRLGEVFNEAGWHQTDRLNPKTVWHLLVTNILNRPYQAGPGIPVFWNSRPNNFAYEQMTEERTIRKRHHIHFWQTPYVTTGERRVWVGTAHYDKGVKLRTAIIVPAHSIDPAVDKERQKVVDDLTMTTDVEQLMEMTVVEPTLGKNDIGDIFFTDGQAAVIWLR